MVHETQIMAESGPWFVSHYAKVRGTRTLSEK